MPFFQQSGSVNRQVIPRGENLGQAMKHIYEIGLTGGFILAALAFGGTETPYFSVVQITLLGLGVLLLVTYDSTQMRDPRPPVVIPLLLVGFTLMQWFHLPLLKNLRHGTL